MNFSSYVYGPTCRSFSIILKVGMMMNGIVTKLVPFIKYMKKFQYTVKVKWSSCLMRPFPTAEGASFQRVMVIIQPPEFLLIFVFFPLCPEICCFQDYLPITLHSEGIISYFPHWVRKTKSTSFPKELPLHPSLVG